MDEYSAYLRFACFNCEKGFEEDENGMCPYCHSTNIVDKNKEEKIK